MCETLWSILIIANGVNVTSIYCKKTLIDNYFIEVNKFLDILVLLLFDIWCCITTNYCLRCVRVNIMYLSESENRGLYSGSKIWHFNIDEVVTFVCSQKRRRRALAKLYGIIYLCLPTRSRIQLFVENCFWYSERNVN